MLTIYGRATSSNVQLVMWAVAELGLDHERLDYGHIHGGLDTDTYGAMNPHRKVPTLRDGDLIVWESMAILRYLAARYGDGGTFWPADPTERASVDMLAEWGKNEVCQAFTVPIFWSRVRTPAVERDEAALTEAIDNFEILLDQLDTPLSEHAYITGDTLSAADIPVGHLLYRWFTMDIPRRPRAALEAYYARLQTRPAYRDHVMVDYASLAAPGA
ncbi:MAG: glutathione S-transferase family protein [Pseudomonadota bacterium]